jgi:hypothetical protein
MCVWEKNPPASRNIACQRAFADRPQSRLLYCLVRPLVRCALALVRLIARTPVEPKPAGYEQKLSVAVRCRPVSYEFVAHVSRSAALASPLIKGLRTVATAFFRLP